MTTSVLDDKRRIVLPKEIAEELGLAEGTPVSFKRSREGIVIERAEKNVDALRDMMEWNPRRQGRSSEVRERDVKGIWEE